MFEKQFVDSHKFIIATDEVGRGPLAGPVVTCAVKVRVTDLNTLVRFLSDYGVTDSKKLNLKKMESILEKLQISKFQKDNLVQVAGCDVRYAVQKVTPRKIDKINIFEASLLGMKNASHEILCDEETVVLIDGKFAFKSSKINSINPVIKGDSKSTLIGLASIIAKVCRDQIMIREAKRYPHYGFEKNSGYPTKLHRDAIATYGITPIHRKSFKGVKEYVQQGDES